MCKKLSLLALVSLLLLVDLPLVSAHNVDLNPNNPNIWGAPDPTTLVIDTPFEPATLDPADAYDAASQEVIMNVYEPLLFFDRDYTLGPYDAGKMDNFVPRLSTSWTEQTISETSPEGLTWHKKWTFTVRTNVKFHDNSSLTPEDVEFSFERLMVFDRAGGPSWMLNEPLLDEYHAKDPTADSSWGLKIDHAVESNATHVWFNLVSDFPSLMFKQILSQTVGSVVEKAWVQSKGGLNIESVPGGWSNWAYIWNFDGPDIYTLPDWHDPPISEIGNVMMGTGPYKLSEWIPGSYWSVERFSDYWDGWPARKAEGSSERLPSFISTVVWYYLPFWVTRRDRFFMGASDLTYVDRKYRDQVLGHLGIRCFYRSTDSLSLSVDAVFFNFNIDTVNNQFYTPTWYPPGTFGENGIPPDIFSDINVRKGFAYAFPYSVYLEDIFVGEGETPSDPVIKGIPYDNPAQTGYLYDRDRSRYYFELAWGGVDNRSGVPGVPVIPEDPNYVNPGALWNGGMKFSIVYPYGYAAWEQAAILLADNVNDRNPEKFHVGTQHTLWFLFASGVWMRKMPIFVTAYQGDFLDPHGFVYTFMDSQGTVAHFQGYSNPTVDHKIRKGITTPDGQQRQQTYYQLQALYHDDVPSLPIIQPRGREFERDWMRGWYSNPLQHGRYIYHRWKALTHFGDANNDGLVDSGDLGVISAHWGGPPPGSLGYAPQADLSGGIGGTTGSLSGPVPGISDGVINIVDVSMVNAYLDGPPLGANHP